MRITILILFTGITLSLKAADDLMIRAYWDAGNPNLRQDDALTSNVEARIAIQLENTGTGIIRVPRKIKPLLWTWGESREKGVVVYHFGYSSAIGNRRGLPSPAELDVVELLSGEVSEVWCVVTIPRGVRLGSILLEYVVEETLGRRYSTWIGRKAVPVMKQTITNPK